MAPICADRKCALDFVGARKDMSVCKRRADQLA
jgi:hypothetical protein